MKITAASAFVVVVAASAFLLSALDAVGALAPPNLPSSQHQQQHQHQHQHQQRQGPAAAAASATTSTTRRSALGGMLGGAAALVVVTATTAIVDGPAEPAYAAAARTGTASPFTGDYDDPNHPGCLRQVKVVGAPLKGDGTRSAYPVLEVTGWDGDGTSQMCTANTRPTRSQLWKITGTVRSTNTAVLDFSPKGGPAKLAAVFEDGGIVFPDGNKWTKVPLGTNDRRPADMSTLKSDG